jgi:hypothetical protein
LRSAQLVDDRLADHPADLGRLFDLVAEDVDVGVDADEVLAEVDKLTVAAARDEAFERRLGAVVNGDEFRSQS